MTLGEKIKSLRIEKKLTQKDLAGDRITRNMLSRIECDKANPSLDTLTYLAEGLNIPLYLLFADTSNAAFIEKNALIEKIYESYKHKNYKAAINFINRISNLDQELLYILASSHFEQGKICMRKGELLSARSHLNNAKKYSDQCIFDTEHINALIHMYLAITNNIQAPRLEFDEEIYLNTINLAHDYEFYKYLVQDTEFKFSNAVFKKHLTAKFLIKQRNYTEALRELIEAAEINNTSQYNAFAIFGIYSDIEFCYKELMDFENAYKYSTKRFSLIEGFKS